MKSLADGTGLDMLVFDSSFFGQYTVHSILQGKLKEFLKLGDTGMIL